MMKSGSAFRKFHCNWRSTPTKTLSLPRLKGGGIFENGEGLGEAHKKM